ncbi:hypothetical protein BESB_045160 [Besnoitia besnoiti]|uniref:non-specific serine/threonine protein kinase n=1 Tax=Besnoitia besnoiti TaxID=94643 RepID=A0A2A9MGN3_BESBE|nr:hypothetical protein BESB_045160 [Besnoitia besnoiti]PFH36324.1 hypothetical protein BESB_045160 [Besnoitia besnoiti]
MRSREAEGASLVSRLAPTACATDASSSFAGACPESSSAPASLCLRSADDASALSYALAASHSAALQATQTAKGEAQAAVATAALTASLINRMCAHRECPCYQAPSASSPSSRSCPASSPAVSASAAGAPPARDVQTAHHASQASAWPVLRPPSAEGQTLEEPRTHECVAQLLAEKQRLREELASQVHEELDAERKRVTAELKRQRQHLVHHEEELRLLHSQLNSALREGTLPPSPRPLLAGKTRRGPARVGTLSPSAFGAAPPRRKLTPAVSQAPAASLRQSEALAEGETRSDVTAGEAVLRQEGVEETNSEETPTRNAREEGCAAGAAETDATEREDAKESEERRVDCRQSDRLQLKSEEEERAGEARDVEPKGQERPKNAGDPPSLSAENAPAHEATPHPGLDGTGAPRAHTQEGHEEGKGAFSRTGADGALGGMRAGVASSRERPDSTVSGSNTTWRRTHFKHADEVLRHGVSILSHYVMKQLVGSGTWGDVFIAVERASGLHRAVKRISKRSAKAVEHAEDEVLLLQRLDHPNIIKVYECFEDYSYVYIVMELCRGGDLYDAILQRMSAVGGPAPTSSPFAYSATPPSAWGGAAPTPRRPPRAPFDELGAAVLMHQIFSAVHYCHCKEIAHRDIKPENFLLTHPNSFKLKLIDFGLSRSFLYDADELPPRTQRRRRDAERRAPSDRGRERHGPPSALCTPSPSAAAASRPAAEGTRQDALETGEGDPEMESLSNAARISGAQSGGTEERSLETRHAETATADRREQGGRASEESTERGSSRKEQAREMQKEAESRGRSQTGDDREEMHSPWVCRSVGEALRCLQLNQERRKHRIPSLREASSLNAPPPPGSASSFSAPSSSHLPSGAASSHSAPSPTCGSACASALPQFSPAQSSEAVEREDRRGKSCSRHRLVRPLHSIVGTLHFAAPEILSMSVRDLSMYSPPRLLRAPSQEAAAEVPCREGGDGDAVGAGAAGEGAERDARREKKSTEGADGTRQAGAKPLDCKFGYDGRFADSWSCGVLLYLLLSGDLPFDGRSDADVLHRMLHSSPSFAGNVWKPISSVAKDLICRLLTVPPTSRLLPGEALRHPFFHVFLPHTIPLPLHAFPSLLGQDLRRPSFFLEPAPSWASAPLLRSASWRTLALPRGGGLPSLAPDERPGRDRGDSGVQADKTPGSDCSSGCGASAVGSPSRTACGPGPAEAAPDAVASGLAQPPLRAASVSSAFPAWLRRCRSETDVRASCADCSAARRSRRATWIRAASRGAYCGDSRGAAILSRKEGSAAASSSLAPVSPPETGAAASSPLGLAGAYTPGGALQPPLEGSLSLSALCASNFSCFREAPPPSNQDEVPAQESKSSSFPSASPLTSPSATGVRGGGASRQGGEESLREDRSFFGDAGRARPAVAHRPGDSDDASLGLDSEENGDKKPISASVAAFNAHRQALPPCASAAHLLDSIASAQEKEAERGEPRRSSAAQETQNGGKARHGKTKRKSKKRAELNINPTQAVALLERLGRLQSSSRGLIGLRVSAAGPLSASIPSAVALRAQPPLPGSSAASAPALALSAAERVQRRPRGVAGGRHVLVGGVREVAEANLAQHQWQLVLEDLANELGDGGDSVALTTAYVCWCRGPAQRQWALLHRQLPSGEKLSEDHRGVEAGRKREEKAAAGGEAAAAQRDRGDGEVGEAHKEEEGRKELKTHREEETDVETKRTDAEAARKEVENRFRRLSENAADDGDETLEKENDGDSSDSSSDSGQENGGDATKTSSDGGDDGEEEARDSCQPLPLSPVFSFPAVSVPPVFHPTTSNASSVSACSTASSWGGEERLAPAGTSDANPSPSAIREEKGAKASGNRRARFDSASSCSSTSSATTAPLPTVTTAPFLQPTAPFYPLGEMQAPPSFLPHDAPPALQDASSHHNTALVYSPRTRTAAAIAAQKAAGKQAFVAPDAIGGGAAGVRGEGLRDTPHGRPGAERGGAAPGPRAGGARRPLLTAAVAVAGDLATGAQGAGETGAESEAERRKPDVTFVEGPCSPAYGALGARGCVGPHPPAARLGAQAAAATLMALGGGVYLDQSSWQPADAGTGSSPTASGRGGRETQGSQRDAMASTATRESLPEHPFASVLSARGFTVSSRPQDCATCGPLSPRAGTDGAGDAIVRGEAERREGDRRWSLCEAETRRIDEERLRRRQEERELNFLLCSPIPHIHLPPSSPSSPHLACAATRRPAPEGLEGAGHESREHTPRVLASDFLSSRAAHSNASFPALGPSSAVARASCSPARLPPLASSSRLSASAAVLSPSSASSPQCGQICFLTPYDVRLFPFCPLAPILLERWLTYARKTVLQKKFSSTVIQIARGEFANVYNALHLSASSSLSSRPVALALAASGVRLGARRAPPAPHSSLAGGAQGAGPASPSGVAGALAGASEAAAAESLRPQTAGREAGGRVPIKSRASPGASVCSAEEIERSDCALEQLQRLEGLFMLLDRDGDGQLTPEELFQGLRHLALLLRLKWRIDGARKREATNFTKLRDKRLEEEARDVRAAEAVIRRQREFLVVCRSAPPGGAQAPHKTRVSILGASQECEGQSRAAPQLRHNNSRQRGPRCLRKTEESEERAGPSSTSSLPRCPTTQAAGGGSSGSGGAAGRDADGDAEGLGGSGGVQKAHAREGEEQDRVCGPRPSQKRNSEQPDSSAEGLEGLVDASPLQLRRRQRRRLLLAVWRDEGDAKAFVEACIRDCDTNDDGVLDLSEFLTASADERIFARQDVLKAAFHKLDRNGDGRLSVSEVQQALGWSETEDASSPHCPPECKAHDEEGEPTSLG